MQWPTSTTTVTFQQEGPLNHKSTEISHPNLQKGPLCQRREKTKYPEEFPREIVGPFQIASSIAWGSRSTYSLQGTLKEDAGWILSGDSCKYVGIF